MNWLKRFFLWLIGVAVPVVIAACYGMPYRYNKNGFVVDSQTKTGITGIQVDCMDGNYQESRSMSYEEGSFSFWYDVPCTEVRFTDVDGAENGGVYLEKNEPFCKDCEPWVVELTKQ